MCGSRRTHGSPWSRTLAYPPRTVQSRPPTRALIKNYSIYRDIYYAKVGIYVKVGIYENGEGGGWSLGEKMKKNGGKLNKKLGKRPQKCIFLGY